MARMSKAHQRAHNAFLDVHPTFDPVKCYEGMCKLLKVSEEAIERGLGKLFREGKLKSKDKKPPHRKSKRAAPRDEF